MNAITMALTATICTWLMTALGAAVVIFFRRGNGNTGFMNALLGFAAGVMIAASFWSLLEPAVDMASAAGKPAWLIAAAGFVGGAAFLCAVDKTCRRVRRKADVSGKNRTAMLLMAITLHNIPEGLAVGVVFGALTDGFTAESLSAAIAVAAGIGIQNFPEGAAVSLPLRRAGYSRWKSFFWGQASGLVEPAAGILGAALVISAKEILPYALSFAAGAMILVAVHELIPECRRENDADSYTPTFGIIAGFAVMMTLDVMLG